MPFIWLTHNIRRFPEWALHQGVTQGSHLGRKRLRNGKNVGKKPEIPAISQGNRVTKGTRKNKLRKRHHLKGRRKKLVAVRGSLFVHVAKKKLAQTKINIFGGGKNSGLKPTIPGRQ